MWSRVMDMDMDQGVDNELNNEHIHIQSLS